MENTKFKIGQKAWYMYSNSIVHGKVTGIAVLQGKFGGTTSSISCDLKPEENLVKYYFADHYDTIDEKDLFESKEDLMEHLFGNVKESI